VIGGYFEQRTAELLGGEQHKTDARCDYCPDVSVLLQNGRSYFEVKAVGRSKQAFVYAGRLVKDRRLAQLHPLTYILWGHTLATQDYETVAELLLDLPELTLGYYRIPFADFDRLLSSRPLEKLNSRYGGSTSNPLYGSGYRIHLSALKAYFCAV
jgi:hypothetical protein